MIDWDRVSELRDEIGADDFAEVVEIFLEEVEEEMGKLDSPEGEDGMHGLLHLLKGSALNLGFAGFSDECQQAETKVRSGETVDIDQIKSSYAASKSEFLKALAQLDAA